jgi:hypothetical protein
VAVVTELVRSPQEHHPHAVGQTIEAVVQVGRQPLREGLKGRAARYVMQSGMLFVNMQYPSIADMRAQLEAEYADASDLETMRTMVKQHAERTIILRVGRAVVFALAKQHHKEWDQKALETASSPESLSMAADDFADALIAKP